MIRQKTQEIQELSVRFLPETFVIEDVQNKPDDIIKIWKEKFEINKYSALFHLGFLKKEKWFSPSIKFLYHIAELLIKKLCCNCHRRF